MGRNKRNIHHETRTAPHMRLTELTLSQFILLYGITVIKKGNCARKSIQLNLKYAVESSVVDLRSAILFNVAV